MRRRRSARRSSPTVRDQGRTPARGRLRAQRLGDDGDATSVRRDAFVHDARPPRTSSRCRNGTTRPRCGRASPSRRRIGTMFRSRWTTFSRRSTRAGAGDGASLISFRCWRETLPAGDQPLGFPAQPAGRDCADAVSAGAIPRPTWMLGPRRLGAAAVAHPRFRPGRWLRAGVAASTTSSAPSKRSADAPSDEWRRPGAFRWWAPSARRSTN